ncbi:MAG: hypothetical protein V4611_00350 [Patescibacteria group bacterium]
MDFLSKLENTIFEWFKSLPDLPAGGRKWLGDNIWWIALIGAILTALGVLGTLTALASLVSLFGTVAATYYATSSVTTWAIVTGVVGLVFSILELLLLAFAIKPLKEKQKKGWVLLFATWLLGGFAVIVNAILSLSIIGFIFGVLFGAIWVAISGYFLFEIHGQFAHVQRSAGVKKGVKVTK